MENKLKLGNKKYEALHEREDEPLRISYKWVIRNLDEEGKKNIESLLNENLGTPVKEENNITFYGRSTNILSYKKYDSGGIEMTSRIIDLTKRNVDSFYQNLEINPVVDYWGSPEEEKSHVLFELSEKRQPEQIEPVILDKSEIIKKY